MGYKTLLTSAMLLASIFPNWAQEYEESSYAWKEGPLTLNQFQGQKLKSDTSKVLINWTWEITTEKKKIPFGKISYSTSNLFMNQNSSWIDPSYQNEYTLRSCQTAFNLLEAYRRKTERSILTNPEADPGEIANFYINQYKAKFEEMEDSTLMGTRTDIMCRYEAQVDSMLAIPEPDLSEAPMGSLRGRFDFTFGLNMMTTSNECFEKAPWGVHFGMLWGIRRNLIGMSVNGNFNGKSKNNYETSRGPIYEGDEVQSLQISFEYGFLMNPNEERAFYPTIGIGGHNITGNKMPGEDESAYISGFMFNVGCLYDIPLYRSIHKYTGFTPYYFSSYNGHPYRQTATKMAFSLQLRPNISFTNVDSGLFPMFNLGIILSWNGSIYDNRK